MLKIAILDDDNIALNISKGVATSYLEEKKYQYSLLTFSSSLNFLASAKEEHYDLVLLDIDMPEMNGIEVARRIKDISFDTSIIFLSEKENLVFECFEVHPFGFIRKSKLYDDFSKVLNSFFEQFFAYQDDKDILTIKTSTVIYSFKINEIVYIEGNRNYQTIYKKNGESTSLRILMKDLEEALNDKGFIRIQKGFIVNSSFIQRIETKEVILINKLKLPLSPKLKDEVIKKYLSLTRNANNLFID